MRSALQRQVYCGSEGLLKLATLPSADIVLIAIVGTAGLQPALAAIRAGKDIAVASKEILVMAGEIVMSEAAKHGVRVLAVDSEHSAIFQCLDGKPAVVRPPACGSPLPAARFAIRPKKNSPTSPSSARSNIRRGSWAARSRSIPPRSSTKASR